VRLVDADGTQLGITPLPEALQLAYSKEMDLVEVAPDANPPVCKVMDFNKYKYDMAQRAKEAKRKSTTTTVKEMKYRVKIGKGDLETKTRQVARFLGEGHKVKITIMFRGRENDHPELGLKILDWVVEHVDHVAKVEAAPKRDGRNMVMVLAPDKQKQQQHAKEQAELASSASAAAAVAPEPVEPVEPIEAPVAEAEVTPPKDDDAQAS
jgi:translation initiation factor IF-3